MHSDLSDKRHFKQELINLGRWERQSAESFLYEGNIVHRGYRGDYSNGY